MKTLYLAFAMILGMALPIQIGLNAILAKYLSSPYLSALINYIIGGIAILIVAFMVKAPFSNFQNISAAPVWIFLGGLLGALYIAGTIIVAPKIGAGMTLSLVVAGQMIIALFLDHFGLIGFPQISISSLKLLGVGLIIMGVFLIKI